MNLFILLLFLFFFIILNILKDFKENLFDYLMIFIVPDLVISISKLFLKSLRKSLPSKKKGKKI